MPTQEEIYQTEGERYDALIAREDRPGNILRALQKIAPLEGRVVYDLGAGTGRLALLLAPFAARVCAFDLSAEMLRVCRRKLTAAGFKNWSAALADHRRLPVPRHSADWVVSGWSVSYLAVWNPAAWREALEAWMREMRRVVKPGGFVALLETLGTGNEAPVRVRHLENVYLWLEQAGFQSEWIRTDYEFESLEEAETLSRFFFGDELGDTVRQRGWKILPECTGVWRKQM